MTLLSDFISVTHRSVRATNIESDLRDPAVFDGYSAGAHVLEAVRRVAAGVQPGPRTRAWSITGPYGAGKSSFALFLLALLGPTDDPRQRVAAKHLTEVDAQLAGVVGRERRRLRLETRGVCPAVVVADREPVANAIGRALLTKVETTPGKRHPGRSAKARTLQEAVGRSEPVASEVVLAALNDLLRDGPVVLIVDELGKALEYGAQRGEEGDLFLLQQIAERFSSADDFEGAVLTLQHMSFEDYLAGAGQARRREWRKVHGRFDDIPFIADRAHGIRLISNSIDADYPTPAVRRQIQKVTTAMETNLANVAPHLLPPSLAAGAPEGVYPLHPLAAMMLPELAASFGQHDRSLVSFLASDGPFALPAFLRSHRLSGKGQQPVLRLAGLYDHFLAGGTAAALSGPDGGRIREIQNRVDGAAELEPAALDTLKTVAILNLAPPSARLVASPLLLEAALLDPDASRAQIDAHYSQIEALVERGLLVYRGFSDEYRVWEGSDFDLNGQISAARDSLTADDVEPLVLRVMSEACPPRSAVAQRHSQERHVLRFFESRYASVDELETPACTTEAADGLVLSVLAKTGAPKAVPIECVDGRPLIVVWSAASGALTDLVLDLAATNAVLTESPDLIGDPVARREIRHRLEVVQATLAEAVETAFDPDSRAVTHFVRGRRTKLRRRAGFATILSELCDERYPATPIVRNEMLNRRDLTSQGAKARRTLLERMFTHSEQEHLGIEGFGPERAMYEAVLAHPGLHGVREGALSFGPPRNDAELRGVWDATMAFLDQATDRPHPVDHLYLLLQAPPFGMKEGPIPVLLAAALQHRQEDVFLYQDETFQPVVDATLIERLLKAPERFSVKRAALVGIRTEVFELLKGLLTSPPSPRRGVRNATTLAVVRPLLSFAQGLPLFSRNTTGISDQARAVSSALLNATEPDELLFRELPIACNLPAVEPNVRDDALGPELVKRLRTALADLGSAYDHLLDRVSDLLRQAFGSSSARIDLREDLRSRARHLIGSVIEPKLRAFLLSAADEHLDDREWLEAVAMTITSKPPSTWSDHDASLFEALLAERAAWFRRLESLHFETFSAPAEGFDARRITLTAPDGTEHHEIVRVDRTTQEIASDAIEEALRTLAGHLGDAEAPAAMLGALVARVIESRAPAPVAEAKVVPAKRKSA